MAEYFISLLFTITFEMPCYQKFFKLQKCKNNNLQVVLKVQILNILYFNGFFLTQIYKKNINLIIKAIINVVNYQ